MKNSKSGYTIANLEILIRDTLAGKTKPEFEVVKLCAFRYSELDEDKKREIGELAITLANSCQNMSPLSALMVFYAIGSYKGLKNGNKPVNLVQAERTGAFC